VRPRAGLQGRRRGIERVDELRAIVDLGQGLYFGQATEKPMAVEARMVKPTVQRL
jgi:hypothetical protein